MYIYTQTMRKIIPKRNKLDLIKRAVLIIDRQKDVGS